MSVQGFLQNVQGIGNITQGAVDVLGRLTGGSFWAQLRPASYRGVAFGVTSGTAKLGRRNAIHEYPFRDIPWVEDLGRAARRITITGFLVGDDVIAQREKMIQAVERGGEGELVHPTLGRRTVALLDFTSNEHWDQGRVFEIQFTFVEQGQRLYPTTTASAQQTAATAAAAVDGSSVAAFAKKAIAVLQQGAMVANAVARDAAAFATRALQASRDATSLFNLAVSLPGEFGRLLGQLRGITPGQIVPLVAGLTVQGLTGTAAAAGVTVGNAVGALTTAGQALGPVTTAAYVLAAQGLAEAVRVAAPTPGHAILAEQALLAYPAVRDGVGGAQTGQQASGDALRRAAVAAMVRSAAEYRPASTDDALAVRTAVLAAIDAETLVAGDQGDDDVYAALRAVRASIVQTLNAVGAGLPTLVTVSTVLPQPSLVLAQRLYRDAARADELVLRANPPHPAFMPTRFQAVNA